VGSLVGWVGRGGEGEFDSGFWMGRVMGEWALGLLGLVVWVIVSMEIWVGMEESIGSHVAMW
jgi:hypothetical protein